MLIFFFGLIYPLSKWKTVVFTVVDRFSKMALSLGTVFHMVKFYFTLSYLLGYMNEKAMALCAIGQVAHRKRDGRPIGTTHLFLNFRRDYQPIIQRPPTI